MAGHQDLAPAEEAAGEPARVEDALPPDPSFRSKVAKGVVGAFAYQIFSAGLSLVSMFAVARLVTPAEFGVFVLVNLVLQALMSMALGTVARHALYRGETSEPPWNLYFLLLVVAQSANILICNSIALFCWLAPVHGSADAPSDASAYRQLAPFLHLASIGFVVEIFAELDRVMSLKNLQFSRIQVLSGISETLRIVVVLVCAVGGVGLYGLVLGNSVLISTPFMFHLLFVRHWRPNPSEWIRVSRAELLAPVKFALNYTAANAGNSLRQFAESALYPLAFTASQVGLLSRALSLYSQTAGRVLQGFNDTASAALPSLNTNPERLSRGAAVYLMVIGGLLFAAVGFLGTAGPTLSSVLYGPRWKEADPYILPASIQAASVFFVSVCSTTLLAAGRQRSNLILLAVLAVGSAPSVIALAVRVSPHFYLWTQGVSFTVIAGVGMWLCRPIVGLRVAAARLAPPAVAALAASAACFATDSSLQTQIKWLRLPIDLFAYVAVYGLVMRFAFPRWLSESLNLLPNGNVVRRWLWLPA